MASPAVSQPLIQQLFPARGSIVRNALLVAFGVALISLAAQVRIDIGPIPVTLQTLAIFLIAAAYGSSLATLTMLTYLLVGGFGMGVFTGAASGWAYMTGATGGYLIGFLAAATVVGFLADRGWDKRFSLTVAAMFIGTAIIYAFGLLWLKQFAPDWQTTFMWGLTPFVAGDLVKILISASILPLAWKLLGKA